MTPSDTTLTYTVDGISCSSCSALISEELAEVAGVADVTVDVPTKTVVVHGTGLDDAAMRALLIEIGYAPA